MAIGDTLRPELLRSDTSGILQGGIFAGGAAERGLSQFGAAVGAAWKDLNEKKEKRRDEAEASQAIQRLDPSLSSADALAMARNKNVMDFQSRMKADAQANQLMEYRDLQMQAMEDDARLRKEQEAGQRQFLDRITAPTDTEETRELQEGFDAFHQNVYPKVMSWVERFSGRGMSPEDEAQWRKDQAISEEARLAPTRGPSLVEDPSPQAFLGIAGDLANPYAQQAALDAAAKREAIDLEKQQAATKLALAIGASGRAAAAEGRAVAKAEQEVRQEARELSVLGFEGLKVRDVPISGQIGDRVTALKTKEELSSFNDLIGKIEELQLFAKQREEELWMDTEDKLAAENLSRQIQALMREEVLGPGTVQQAERDILEKMAGDPTKFWSLKKGDTGRRLLENLKDGLTTKFKTKLQTLGLKVSKGSGGSSAGGSQPPALPSGISGLVIEEL